MSAEYRLNYEIADGEIPYIMLTPAGDGAPLPTVILLHGNGSQKEHLLPRLYAFAQAGFRSVALDLSLHGERRRFDSTHDDGEQRIETLIYVVQQTVRDVSRLLDHLQITKAAIHGISLGGIILFAAFVQEPRLTVASVVMGNPDWAGMLQQMGMQPGQPVFDLAAAHSPLELAARTYPLRPLLMLHGDADTIVSVDGVKKLYQILAPIYAASSAQDRLRLEVIEGLDHVMTDDMLAQSIAWTRRYAAELV